MLIFLIAAFAATVPAANWMIQNIGQCIPNGPCLIPVGFDLHAPSGVLMIGAAFVLRDLVHERGGASAALAAIVIGTALSLIVAPPTLVLASGVAFMLAELADMAVYSPLRRRHLGASVLLSGLAGSVVDSAAFLLIAFGSLDFIAGQVVGKMWMSIVGMAVLVALRRWEQRA